LWALNFAAKFCRGGRQANWSPKTWKKFFITSLKALSNLNYHGPSKVKKILTRPHKKTQLRAQAEYPAVRLVTRKEREGIGGVE